MVWLHRKPKLPDGLAGEVRGEKGAVLHFADDTWMLAAKSGLYAFSEGKTRHWSWHELQQILWNRKADVLRVEFADPSRPASQWANPERTGLKHFGDLTRLFLNHSQIFTQFGTTPSGVKIRGTIRELPDGTRFSEVVAFGALELGDEAFVAAFEAEVRDAAGLRA